MIINCEVAVCIPTSQEPNRFVRAKVGVGHDVVSESHYLVVVRTNHRDRFHLSKSNVKILRASFEFKTPNRYVMIRECDEHLLQSLKLLVRKIIDQTSPLPKVPKIERIYQLKPSQASVSSIGAQSQADLKKLTNKCLKTIELSSLKTIPREIWALRNLAILKLTDGEIKRIPRELHQLHQTLSCLVLSNNQIDEIPMWFCKRMQCLKTLDLSHNRLRSVPFEIILLKSCKSLNFSHNSIPNLPNIFSMKIFNGTVYDQINLSHNKLHYIHANETRFANPTQSTLHSEIDISHNQFAHDWDLAKRLDQILSMSKDSSLFTLTLEKIIADQRLFVKMFVDTIMPKPIYKILQERIFMCFRCKKLRVRLGHYTINTVNQIPLNNFSGRFTHDISRNVRILYLYCKLCKESMDSGL